MSKVFAVVAAWLLCGLYTWGTLMADWDYRYRNEWVDLNHHSRDAVGVVFFESAIGPAGVIVAVTTCNFNQHGWELWEKPE